MKTKKKEDICNQIWVLSCTLKSLGALFERQNCETPYDQSEFFGLDQMLGKLSEGLSEIEESLRSNL